MMRLASTSGATEISLLEDLHKARGALRQAVIKRWKGETVRPQGHSQSSGISENWGTWAVPPPAGSGPTQQDRGLAAQLELEASRLRNAYLPLTIRGRTRAFRREIPAAEALLEACLAAESRGLAGLESAIASSLRAGAAGANAAVRQAVTGWVPPVGIAEGLPRSLTSTVPGDGRFILQSGWIHIEPPICQVGSHQVSGGTPAELPALVDLDEEGGLISDSAAAINFLIRRMLALLPAGQLQLKVFDPKKLGGSVKDLFRVDGVSSKVIPDKIFSTQRELEELLEKLEIHLTDVTRKYLGAKYRSLHQYNLSAGEVAEPYRVVAIFDFPNGWDRGDGRVDWALASRLAKIIEAGPACGVFTLLHCPQPADLSAFRLPALFARQWQGELGASAPRRAQWPSSSDPQAAVARAGESTAVVQWSQRVHWRPPTASDAEPGSTKALTQRLAADIVSAANVSVGLSKVTSLAQAKAAEDARAGIGAGPPIADPRNPKTWWRGVAAGQLVARFGRLGATGVAEFRLDGGVGRGTGPAWLIGGVPGSGKSILLHAIIIDMCINYSPAEVELWLADLKHGVEFKPYAAGKLPHAKVVGLQAGREFGVDMLRHIEAEQVRRGDEFRRLGIQRLKDYPRSTNSPMPMLVAIIDEFQGLFEEDDRLGQEAARLLDHIIKQGPGFGVHIVLASQQISGVALPRQVLGLIACRIAMQSSESDSQVILGNDSNSEAADLTRAGEGIINTAMNGARDANQRFQTTHIKRNQVVAIVGRLRQEADARNWQQKVPVVMDSSVAVRMGRAERALLKSPTSGRKLEIPLGKPMGIGPTVCLKLEREPEANGLLVASPAVAASVIGQFAARSLMGGVRVVVLDFAGLGGDLAVALDPIAAEVGRRNNPPLRFARAREAATTIAKFKSAAQNRERTGQYRSSPAILILANVNRAGSLDPTAQDDLDILLRTGPEVGVHVFVHAESPALLGRFPIATRDFSIRIVGNLGPTDSDAFTESALASNLPPDRAVLAMPRLGYAATVRLFQLPPAPVWARL